MSELGLQHVGGLLPVGALDLVQGECATHGTSNAMVRTGRAWHCRACLDEQLKAEMEEKPRIERAGNLRASAALPAKYLDAKFPAVTHEQKLVVATARAFLDALAKGRAWRVLALVGEKGTGKTLLACELARALIDRLGMSVRYATAQSIIGEIQATYGAEGKSEQAEIARFSQYDVLIIDEIDAKRSSENANLLLTEIINQRYNAEKPVVVITNQAFDTLGRFVGDRVADRLRENMLLCAFTWPSFRRAA